jgi:hypothetical protein
VLELAEGAYSPVYSAQRGDAGETEARLALTNAQRTLAVVVPACKGMLAMGESADVDLTESLWILHALGAGA